MSMNRGWVHQMNNQLPINIETGKELVNAINKMKKGYISLKNPDFTYIKKPVPFRVN